MHLCSAEYQEENEKRGYQCISPIEQMLSNQMRLLWEQHVYWTRLVISGIVFDSPDLEQSRARLLRNPEDFGSVFAAFYGEETAEEFEKLFTMHLKIADQLVYAAKAGNSTEAAEVEKSWYENADQIAEFLASINSHWSLQRWREMLYSHLAMTKQEAEDFISGNYEASVVVFDNIEREALVMADMMTKGLVRQFSIL